MWVRWFFPLFLTEVVDALILSDCTVELKDELKGPFCTERDVKDAQMLQMITEMNQCMSGFQILEQEGAGALAIPKSACSNLTLTCDKPLDVFPNSCSGFGDLLGNTTLSRHFEVAYYAYDDGQGRVLAIETYFPDDRRCLGQLLLTEGSCFRLKEPSQKMVGAPTAPEIPGMIDGFIPPSGDRPDTCTASLDGTLEGCESLELLRRCANYYRIYPRDQGDFMGYAEPWLVRCGLIKLTCNKSFGDFPNACSGKMIVRSPGPFATRPFSVDVAFYAYSQSHSSGLRIAKVWETRIVVDKHTTCSGHYVLGCSGVMTSYLDMETSDILAPPMAPALPGMPVPFPMLTPREVETTEAPQPQPTKAVVSPLPWLVAGVCLVAFLRLSSAFFDRRRRRVEQHRMEAGDF